MTLSKKQSVSCRAEKFGTVGLFLQQEKKIGAYNNLVGPQRKCKHNNSIVADVTVYILPLTF